MGTFFGFAGSGMLIFIVVLLLVYGWQALKLSLQPSTGCAQDVLSGAELYLVVQTCAFTILAILIMRLKLFMAPLMCLTSCLVVKDGVLSSCERTCARYRWLTVALLIAGANPWFGGYENVRHELSKVGSFENLAQE